MLQFFVRGCKQAQVAAGTKLQDHDLNLEPVHSSTIFPFSLLHITAVTFSKDKPCKPCKSFVSVGNSFLSTDSVYRSLLKNKLARKPDDTKHRVVRKIQGVPLNLNKAVPVLKKKKQAKTMERTCLHITCCRRMGWLSNLTGTWSFNEFEL